MTIQGAVYELEQMLSRTDIPDYIKPTIKKVIETIVDEFNDQQAESEEHMENIIIYCPNCGMKHIIKFIDNERFDVEFKCECGEVIKVESDKESEE